MFEAEADGTPTWGVRPTGHIQDMTHLVGKGNPRRGVEGAVRSAEPLEWSNEGTCPADGDPPLKEQPSLQRRLADMVDLLWL